jgi:DNA-binding NarL/FixJ family response regulator
VTSERLRPKVLLADDHRLFRQALRLVLAPEYDVVGEAQSAEEAISLAAGTQPDLILLDIGMPGTGGLAAVPELSRSAPNAKILILSQYQDEEYVLDAFSNTATAGYLVKTDAAEELLSAMRVLLEGKRYLSPSVAPILLNRLRNPEAKSAWENLTRREREVLKLTSEGATVKEIASRLGITPKTAQIHRDNLKQKLNLRTTAEMVRYAVRHKIVRVD